MPARSVLSPALSCAALLLPLVALTAQGPPPGFAVETLFDGRIERASAMAFLPDGRLFLCERNTGNVRVFAGGALEVTPWATIPTTAAAQTEQGLLGIAVDPGFLENGFVYFYACSPDGLENRIWRLRDSGGTGVEPTVLTTPGQIPSFGIHAGGRMCFGLDGALYVGTGDVGQPLLAQNLASTAGKILRFRTPDLAVPSDNPFAGSPVWSYGHRNMFGLAVHPVSGDLFQTENGLFTSDELNRIVPGGNYGWPTYEGREPAPDPATVDPLVAYSPPVAPVGCCFYTGANYPLAYVNSWFVAEYSGNRVRRLELDASFTAVIAEHVFHDQPAGSALDVADGPDGNVWLLHNDSSAGRGGDELVRYVHANAPFPGVNLSATSRRILGGSITACFRARPGDLFLGALSTRALPLPNTTPYGDLLLHPDFVAPLKTADADGRAYHAFSVPADPAHLGVTVYLQGFCVPVVGPPTLTNMHSLTVR